MIPDTFTLSALLAQAPAVVAAFGPALLLVAALGLGIWATKATLRWVRRSWDAEDAAYYARADFEYRYGGSVRRHQQRQHIKHYGRGKTARNRRRAELAGPRHDYHRWA